MKKVKPGDRVWVRNPRVMLERKVGTIVVTRRTPGGIGYLVEWEVDLVERPNGHRPGIAPAKSLPCTKGQDEPMRKKNVMETPSGSRALVQLFSSSALLDARVWLDGVYTELEDEGVLGRLMKDREVYFKIEGKTGSADENRTNQGNGGPLWNL